MWRTPGRIANTCANGDPKKERKKERNSKQPFSFYTPKRAGDFYRHCHPAHQEYRHIHTPVEEPLGAIWDSVPDPLSVFHTLLMISLFQQFSLAVKLFHIVRLKNPW